MSYDESSIEVVRDDIIRVRTRPEMYIGDRGWAAFVHLIKEILQNGIDECTADVGEDEKQGNEILASFDERDVSYMNTDNGRGIPQGSLYDICTVLNSSGKFNKEDANSTYKIAAGENGVGTTCANALSEKFIISSIRGGNKKTLYFEKGELQEEKNEKISKAKQGTISYMTPDYSILGKMKPNYKDIMNLCETMNYLSKVKIKAHAITKNGKEINETYNHKNGIMDLLDSLLENPITKPIYINVESPEVGMAVELCFAYDNENSMIEKSDENFLILSYANYCTTLAHGTHVNGLNAGLTNYFVKYIRDNLLNKKELNELRINGEDCKNGLVAVIHVKLRKARFGGQAKSELKNDEVKVFVQNAINTALKEYEKKNKNIIKNIGSFIKDMSKIRNKNKEEKKLLVERKNYGSILSKEKLRKWSGKASERGRMPIEVYIVEGDSASLDGVINRLYQETIKLRGVPKNAVGVSLIKLMENEEIKTILMVVCDGKTHLDSIEDCPIDKLIICSDADIDGNKITSLLGGLCVTRLRPLVEAGRVYKVFPPLYKIIKNGKEIFIKDNEEYAHFLLNEIKKDITIRGIINKKQSLLLKEEDIVNLIIGTRKYYKSLKKLAKQKIMEPELLEYIISNIHYVRDKEYDKFEKKMKKIFKQCSFKKKDKNKYSLKGIYKNDAEFIKIDDKFMLEIDELENFINSIEFMNYDVDGVKYRLAELLALINSYEPKNKQRFKGLGEMKAFELKETILTPGKRNLIRLTMEDCERATRQFDILHNEKAKFAVERNKLLSKFKLDPDIDIDA